MLQLIVRRILRAGAVLCVLALPASAELTQYDTQTYDYLALGAPKFVKTDYIDLNKVTQISKYRSYVGHNYSDLTQFGNADAIRIPFKAIETCVSMKHYYSPPDVNTVIRAPVSGVISRVFEEELGTQIHITSDVQPAFTFSIFHINTLKPAVVGDRVEEGQVLGTHYSQQTFSDIAVAVHTPTGYHLISYFETLTDEAFAPYQARGIATRESMIIPREVTDANRATCGPFTSDPNAGTNFVKLTGGAATQTITATSMQNFLHPGDTRTFSATASSGLPVKLTSSAPKVCAVQGLTATYRRPGTCIMQFVQEGDANTFPASAYAVVVTVAPAEQGYPGRPALGAVYPPSAAGAQSYLRFIAGYSGGAVTLTLTDADTGRDKLTWTSPPIAALSAPQVSIAEIEATAPTGYQRPSMYGLRIENATTLQGALQHILYRPVDGTVTNLTVCSSGFGRPTSFLGNVHTTRLTGFPSTIVSHNATAFDFFNFSMSPYDAATGKALGANYFLRPNNMPSNSGALVTVDEIERLTRVGAPAVNHYLLTTNATPNYPFFQHLVDNTQVGVIADMTAVCNLAGAGIAPPGASVRGGALYGTTQGASQSFLRFYNAGASAGPVSLTLYDMATGANLGQWTSPTIAPRAELQTDIGTIERAIGAAPRDYYEFKADTEIDGYFQHVLWRSSDGTLTNLSICQSGTGADPFTLIGVHSSLLAAQGYRSAIDIVNTGISAQTVTLGLYDARDGAKLGVSAAMSIPAGGQRFIDVDAIEAAARVTPSTAMPHYVVKVEAPFTGFLQHMVNNLKSGVITDMTTHCAM